jgi:hypothetical protein
MSHLVMKRIAVVCGMALVAATMCLEPVHADSPLPTAVVSMGDSYISGNAGRWYGNSNSPFGNRSGTDRAALPKGGYDIRQVYGQTDGACFRSDVAEIKSARIPADSAVNLACSGAKSENIWRASDGGKLHEGEAPQADQLSQVAAGTNIKLIVLSVGGNDVGFGDILTACMMAFVSPLGSPCHAKQQTQVNSKINTAMARVDKAVKEIRAVMSNAGYGSSQYRLVMQSYPSPLPRASEMRYPEKGGNRTYEGCPMFDSDLTWARDALLPQITSRLKEVARANQTDFLDLEDTLQGREVCSKGMRFADGSHPPSATTSEWARFFNTGVLQGELEDSLHPNAYGQLALGTCLRNLWNAGGGMWKCRNVAGAGWNSMLLSPLS